MAKKPKFEAEGAEVQEVELPQEEIAANEAKNAELAELATEEATIQARLVEIKARRRELGVSRASNRGPRGVGAFVKEKILEGLSNEQILDLVATEFPSNNTNTNCINWYRNALKKWPDGKRPAFVKKGSEEAVTEEAVTEEAVTEEAVTEEAVTEEAA